MDGTRGRGSAAMNRKKNRVTCTNHCSACGLHFHSVAAFDAHRIGSFSDPDDPRRCAHPWDLLDKEGKERYVTLTEDGLCAIYEPPQTIRVTVWTLGSSLESARSLGR